MDKLKAIFLHLGIVLLFVFLAYAILLGHVNSQHGGSFKSWWNDWKLGMTLIFGFIALVFILGIFTRLFSTTK